MKLKVLISLGIIQLIVVGGCGSPPLTSVPDSNTPAEIVSTETSIPGTSTPIPAPTEVPMVSAQGFHSMAFDVESNKVILKPYMANYDTLLEPSAWAFDPDEGTWGKHADGPPKGGGSIVYDSQSDRTILFVGKLGKWGKNSGKPAGQTWAYDYNTDTWSEMNPEEGPYNLVGQRMAYDSESDRVILFGGFASEGAGLWIKSYETWAYDFDTNTWTNMQPSGDIPQGEIAFFPISYDAGADRVLAWICKTPSLGKVEGCAINAYDYNSNSWERREMDSHPMSSFYNAMVYDPGTGMNIMFGGTTRLYAGEKFHSDEILDELWGYEYAQNRWTKLSSANLPGGRAWHAMIFDENTDMILMFGGGTSLNTFVNETWGYDPDAQEWRLIVENQ